jgi:hypothetical protein
MKKPRQERAQTVRREETIRRSLMVTAAVCWIASITLTLLVVTGPLDPTRHPGATSVVVLLQSLAITVSVIWAQMRVRRLMIEVMRAGLRFDGRDGEQ